MEIKDTDLFTKVQRSKVTKQPEVTNGEQQGFKAKH